VEREGAVHRLEHRDRAHVDASHAGVDLGHRAERELGGEARDTPNQVELPAERERRQRSSERVLAPTSRT
jgi:hypothetical protein